MEDRQITPRCRPGRRIYLEASTMVASWNQRPRLFASIECVCARVRWIDWSRVLSNFFLWLVFDINEHKGIHWPFCWMVLGDRHIYLARVDAFLSVALSLLACTKGFPCGIFICRRYVSELLNSLKRHHETSKWNYKSELPWNQLCTSSWWFW